MTDLKGISSDVTEPLPPPDFSEVLRLWLIDHEQGLDYFCRCVKRHIYIRSRGVQRGLFASTNAAATTLVTVTVPKGGDRAKVGESLLATVDKLVESLLSIDNVRLIDAATVRIDEPDDRFVTFCIMQGWSW